MSALAAEESTNQANIKDLQPPVTSPSTSNATNASTVTASNASNSNVAHIFPETSIKLNSIIRKKGKWSQTFKDNAVDFNPNKHTIQAVIVAPKAHATVHFSDGIDIQITIESELDSHANMLFR